MKLTRDKVISVAVALTIGCWLLTYFVKPRAADLQFTSPAQELPNYQAQFPGDTKLQDRVTKSYQLAIILTQTPYMQKNLNALECLRRWAKDQFAAQSDFLHPVVMPLPTENRDTVFGAVGYNLFAGLHSWAQEQLAPLVRWRIDDFHGTYAYQTFRVAYFDFFGWDADAAILLSLYQNDRAKAALDVLLWTAAWIAWGAAALAYLYKNRKTAYFSALQNIIASSWAMLALSYFIQCWATEQASSVISMVFAASVSAYLFMPFAMVSHEEGGSRLARIRFTRNWIALAFWLTVSFLAIQVLTWIRHSAPGAADPITMLLDAFTGNFVHDPIHGKRWVTMVTAAIWALAGVWTWRQRKKNYDSEFDPETDINRLDAFQQRTLSVK